MLGRKLAEGTIEGENVGVLLPNVNGVAVTLFGLLFRKRVPVLLNFTAGLRNLASPARRRRSQLSSPHAASSKMPSSMMSWRNWAGAGASCGSMRCGPISVPLDKALGLVDAKLRARSLANRIRRDDPAIILFTSGSEGKPKGVVLTHGNILANARQIASFGHEILKPNDIIFNPLPVFHSYGLTAGFMMGVLSGMKVVLYPSPLHYREIPRLIGKVSATILFGTDTFLVGYARAAEKSDLATVRFVITGAERVKDETPACGTLTARRSLKLRLHGVLAGARLQSPPIGRRSARSVHCCQASTGGSTMCRASRKAASRW